MYHLRFACVLCRTLLSSSFILGSKRKKTKIPSSLWRPCTELCDWIRNCLIIKSSLIRVLSLVSVVAGAGIEAPGT